MRTTLLVVGLVGLLAGTAGAATPTYVIVKKKTTLHQRPSAKSVRLKTKDRAVLRFVAKRGGWLEVEVTKTGYQCGISGFSLAELRVFVRASAVVPVASVDVVRRYRDGSKSFVRKGTPLSTRLLRKLVPKSKRSLQFQLDKTGVTLPKGRRVVVTSTKMRLGNGQRIAIPYGSTVVVVRKLRGKRLVTYVPGSCSRFTGWIPRSTIMPADDDEEGVEGGITGGVPGGVIGGVLGGVGIPSPPPKRTWLIANSDLSWPDKAKAGRTLFTIQIKGAIRVDGNRRCVKLPWSSSFTSTEVCAAATAFRRSAKQPPKERTYVVPLVALRSLRISGQHRIVPSEETRTHIKRSGKSRVVASLKMCLNRSGVVSSATVIKSSGFPTYDRKLVTGVRSWRYRPFRVSGKPVKVCTSVTFIYKQS